MRWNESPRVYCLGQTSINWHTIIDMVEDVTGDKSATTDWKHTVETSNKSAGETLIEVAGRMCYKSFAPGINPNVTRVRTNSKEYFGNILSSGHGSVLEHSSVTFAFIGVSRVFTHEVVRHRAGTAFSQESLRFVRLDDIKMWLPDVLSSADPEVQDTVRQGATASEAAYRKLCKLFNVDSETRFAVKKRLTSAFRRIAPIGLSTNIIVTGNHRAWRHMIEMRSNVHAEEELQRVFTKVGEILKAEYPLIYQDMETCDDGVGWKFTNSKV